MCSELSHLVYFLMGVQMLATSLHHAIGNGGTERVNHTIAQMSPRVADTRLDDLD